MMSKKINKKILFFPGLGEKPKDYRSLSKYIKIADIDWNKDKYKPQITDENILVGFSLGNCYSLDYALKQKIKTLVICSSTPFEHLKGVKADSMIFIAGSKEKFLIDNYKRVIKLLPKSQKNKLVIVKGADHRIVGNYENKLLEILKSA